LGSSIPKKPPPDLVSLVEATLLVLRDHLRPLEDLQKSLR
jgi:hypothetical protein